MSGFQTQINAQPAPAVEGDFASINPMASMLASTNTLRAGSAGVTVGRFAFARNDTGIVSNQNPGVAARLGFVQRDQPGVLITTFLGQASMVQQAGYGSTLFTKGEFWARFAGGAAVGQKVYASYYDGSASAAATATPTTEAVTVSTTNGSAVVSITTAGASPVSPGMPVSGAGIPVGATILAYGTSTGGLGTVTLSANATATATGVAMTTTLNVETPWTVDSTAAAGELAQISTNG